MADSLVIHHPRPDKPVKWLGFVASGVGPKGKKVRARVIDLGTEWGSTTKQIPGKVYYGKVLAQPPNWGVAFKVPEAGTYMLVVNVGLIHHESVIFRVRPKGHFGLSISEPGQGDDVFPTVWAYGGFANETRVSGTMTCNNGSGPHHYNAGPIPVLAPMTIWYLSFNIPSTGLGAEPDSHNPFELVVTGSTGSTDSHNNINVLGLPQRSPAASAGRYGVR
jgi:hypothetical protein